jgi:subtilisin family serine protease
MKNEKSFFSKKCTPLLSVIVSAVFVSNAMLSSAWAQGAIPGARSPVDTPQTPRGGGGGGGSFGFGLSLDLGSIIRAVQSVSSDKYTSPDTANLPQYEPRQLVVSWQAEQQTQAQALLAASGGQVLNQVNLANLGLGAAALTFTTQAQADAALAILQAATPPITADKHAIAYPMQTAAASAGKQYALELLKVQTPAQTRVQSAVVLGFIDTEIASADSLAIASFKAKRIFSDSEKPAPTDHGSGVAAILAGKNDAGFQGLAQGVNLRAAGVMREVAPGINATNTLLVAQALDWLISENAQVVNLSLGSAPDAVLAAVVSKANALGIVLVAAAGNGGSAAAPSYPAAYPGVIAVTAVDANKQLYTRANRGPYVALAAPGVDVWVPVGTTGKGKYMSGTSFASPFVAAAIAQKLAASPVPKGPQTTSTVIKNLCSTALPLGASNPSPEFGCGLMQL